jgi:MFS family permease
MSIVSGRLADRLGHKFVILPGSLLMAAAGVFMYSRVGEERQLLAVWVPFVVIYGLGVGFAHAACQAAALSNVGQERLGIGGAMNRISQEIGQTVSAAIVIALLAREATIFDGIRSVMVLLVVLSLVGAPLAAMLRARGTAAPSSA